MADTSFASPKVAILYGFAEGPLTGRKLRRALSEAGFTSSKPEQADIVIAHSGGFLVMPNGNRPKLLVTVGANTWDQPLPVSLRQKLKGDWHHAVSSKQLHAWFLHGCINIVNFGYIHHIRRLAKGYKNKPTVLPAAERTVIVRNRHDPYCSIERSLQWASANTFISMNGLHDDIWDNPQPYVDIIKLYATDLLA